MKSPWGPRKDSEAQGSRDTSAALRWGGTCLAFLGAMACLAVLAVSHPAAAYVITLALPIPLLWALLRRGGRIESPAPWYAGLCVWAFVVLARAAGAVLAARGVLPFRPQSSLAATGSLFPFIALAILWGERAGGRAFGFTLRRAGLQVVLGIALALALQAALRLPHIVAGGLDLRHADLAATLRDLPFELMALSLGEEALFRGYLQTTLQRRYPWWFATVLASTLFGLWHLPGAFWFYHPYTILATVGVPFAFGLLAGVMVRLSRSIVGPVVAHAVYNAVNAAFL